MLVLVKELEHVVELIQYHHEDDEFLVHILRQHRIVVCIVRVKVEIQHRLIYRENSLVMCLFFSLSL